MTHVEKAAELLRKADEMSQDMERHGTAVVHALAALASAHIQFAGTFGDATS